jgi:hypothetical protein
VEGVHRFLARVYRAFEAGVSVNTALLFAVCDCKSLLCIPAFAHNLCAITPVCHSCKGASHSRMVTYSTHRPRFSPRTARADLCHASSATPH